KMMREDPELKKAVEEALLERALIGDDDPNSGNWVIKKDTNGKYKVRNIDLVEGFNPDHEPVLMGGLGGIGDRISLDFSEKPISPELREKVTRFVERYDTPAGREQLLKTGLKPEEVDAYLARARHISETGKFPRIKFPEDYTQAVEIGTRYGNEVVAEVHGNK